MFSSFAQTSASLEKRSVKRATSLEVELKEFKASRMNGRERVTASCKRDAMGVSCGRSSIRGSKVACIVEGRVLRMASEDSEGDPSVGMRNVMCEALERW